MPGARSGSGRRSREGGRSRRPTSGRNPLRRLGAAGVALTLLFVVAAVVHAHGDTIRVSYSAVRPARLVVKAGTTVHFHNANASGAPCTVVFDEGGTRSPVLGRAEGWHHTFDEPGEYPFHLEEYPSRTGRVVVVAP